MNPILFYLLLALQLVLAIIAIMILIYVFGMVLTFRHSLPFVPTPTSAIRAMIEHARIQPNDRIIDLGSGTGKMTQAVASRFPNPITGIETLWALILVSRLRRWVCFPRRKNYRLLHGDMLATNIADADVILGFLIPWMIKRLVPKFENETKKGTRILSYLFPVPLSDRWKATTISVRVRRKAEWIYKYEKIS